MKRRLYTAVLPPPGDAIGYRASRGIELVETGLGKEPGEDDPISLLKDADSTIVGEWAPQSVGGGLSLRLKASFWRWLSRVNVLYRELQH